LDEGAVAVESSREPLWSATVATIVADTTLLAVDNRLIYELAAAGHVELLDGGGSGQQALLPGLMEAHCSCFRATGSLDIQRPSRSFIISLISEMI
jgi:hypothetical protein